MKIQVPMTSESAVPARKPYAVGAKPMARTAPMHPQTAARTLKIEPAAKAKKPVKFTPPEDDKKLRNVKELTGKLTVKQLAKFRNSDLDKHFKGMDIYDWFNVNGKPVIIAGRILFLYKKGSVKFAQFNTSTQAVKAVAKVASFSKGIESTVEILAADTHLALIAYHRA